MKKNTPFQPVVRDEKRTIRNRFNKLHKKIRLEKQTLAAQIFSKGMEVVEKEAGINQEKQ